MGSGSAARLTPLLSNDTKFLDFIAKKAYFLYLFILSLVYFHQQKMPIDSDAHKKDEKLQWYEKYRTSKRVTSTLQSKLKF